MLKKRIELIAEEFLEKTKDKEIYVISHFDTDGISSAAIMIKTLKKMDKKFSVKILKSLEEDFIKNLPKNKVILFLDLASGSLNHLEKYQILNVFIIDHHEICQKIPQNVRIINPRLIDKQKISGSGLTYLFCKQINPESKDLAKLAILGMIGDCMEKEIDKLNNSILDDGDVKRKRGLLLYPSTRPINRVLEFSSQPYIPGITGNIKGVLELLREINLTPKQGKFKSLLELDQNEMEKLVTEITLRQPKAKHEDLIGDIFLIKLFNKLEDARELSAMINACSRQGNSEIAIQLCLENPKVKKEAELIHSRHRQMIISGLKTATEIEKIEGKEYILINAKDEIKDTIIGTIASILSNSKDIEDGKMIIAMAYYENKIKISARISGREGRNVREVLNAIIEKIGGEVGGHEFAAGCIISREKEIDFIDNLKKHLELEVVKI